MLQIKISINNIRLFCRYRSLHIVTHEIAGRQFPAWHFHGGEKTAGSIESRGNRVWRLSRGYSRSFFSCLSFSPRHLSSPRVKDFDRSRLSSRAHLEQNHKSFSLLQLLQDALSHVCLGRRFSMLAASWQSRSLLLLFPIYVYVDRVFQKKKKKHSLAILRTLKNRKDNLSFPKIINLW